MKVPQPPQVELATHLVHLDEEAARNSLAEAACPAAAVVTAYQQVERRLAGNDSDRAAVAAAASICIRLLASLPFPELDPTRAAAVVAAPAEDRVGAEAVAAALRVAGVPADVLCGQLQPSEIGRHVSRRGSPAVVVTAARSRYLPVLA